LTQKIPNIYFSIEKGFTPGIRSTMNIFTNMFYLLLWIARGIRVFALIGRSGSGKSFRALLIAQKYKIELLIDDGLLIRDQKIIAGRSAKKERAYLSAIKTALFTHDDHCRDVMHALQHQKFKRILLIGTSARMVKRIAKRLDLPQPSRIISIEEIATEEEIKLALKSRKIEGKHIIPVPAIEIKQNYPHLIYESIKIFLGKRVFRKKGQNVFEKTVVRPEFSKRGRLEISELALSQMVIHCVNEFDPGVKIEKVLIKKELEGHSICLHLRVLFGTQLSHSIPDLQKYILGSIETFAGIHLKKVDILIAKIEKLPARFGSE
jgi:adenylate kinase family enzyme